MNAKITHALEYLYIKDKKFQNDFLMLFYDVDEGAFIESNKGSQRLDIERLAKYLSLASGEKFTEGYNLSSNKTCLFCGNVRVITVALALPSDVFYIKLESGLFYRKDISKEHELMLTSSLTPKNTN